MYPEKVYFRVGMDFIETECCTAFKFAAIRKMFYKAWKIKETGPKIDLDFSEGTFDRPLDIGELGISLCDFKLLNMIVSDKDHTLVKNLSGEKVNELD